MSGKMSSHSCQEASNKAVQVSNDIFALPPLMLSHGGTKWGGGGERRGCLVLYGKCQVPRALVC